MRPPPTPQPGQLRECLSEGDLAALAEARVAVMITAFRIGPVLTDTILSALSQQHVNPVAVLLVIDGCPETETTRAIAQRYISAYPGLFQVMWLENGGVSRARNRGLQWLLDRHPKLEAIYCLDGDDLISTTAVATGLLALREAQARQPARRFGWVVSNKMNFGDDYNYIETPERFRPASYLSVNLSQPSCLYNAEMFRQGLRWDETMRSGVEDWEFWLAAIAGEFEGVFNPRDLLYYRRLMGNRSSVNRRNDAYNIPYMRRKHASLFRAQAVLSDEQDTAPRFAFGAPDADPFELTTDPAAPGRPLPLYTARNALAARLQRGAAEAYVYDPYAPDLFVVMDDDLRARLLDAGLLRGLLMAAAEKLSQGGAIVEGLILPLTQAQRAVAGPGDAFLSSDAAAPRPEHARRSFFVIRPTVFCAPDGAVTGPERLAQQARRLRLHSDALPDCATHGHTYAELQRLIRQLSASDSSGDEGRLGQAQTRSNRYYLSSHHIARHSSLTEKAIGTGPLFPQLSASGHRRAAVVLPPEGATPAAIRLLKKLADHLGDAGRISVFGMGTHLPGLARQLPGAIENVTALAPWLAGIDAPQAHSVGVPRWEALDAGILNRLAGLLAPFDEVIVFEMAMFAPVMLKLRGLGVSTVACEPDRPGDALPPPTEAPATARLSDDPVAALNYAAAYDRIICTSTERADLLSGLGYPLSRIDIGAEAYLRTLLPGLAAAAE